MENEQIELKKSTSELKEAVISISAILNKHKKGNIIFGIKNNGSIVGQKVSEATLREISQAIASGIEPKIYPEIKAEIICNKDCIRVSFEGHEQPYFAYGRAYIRVADEDRQLSAKELENIILRKTSAKWDSKASDLALKKIDENTLKQFVERANTAERVKFSYTNKKSILEKLNLIKDLRPTNAAKLLFSASKPIEVQAAVFAGTDKTTFLDIQQFKGNLFQLLKLSEDYIKEHINWRAKLDERERKEIPEVPIRAITEALVNSFCHRDYIAPESNKIAIYRDRIEIWNPGDFPEGYKPQDYIQKELPSILRNPLVANMLYLSADIEKWGSGLKRIDKECRAYKIKAEFKTMNYGFAVEFRRPKDITSLKTVPKIKRWYERWYEKWYEKGFSEREIWLISQIDNNPNISIQKLSEEAGINPSAIQKHIDKLKIKKVIIRYGSAKGGYWKINKAIIVSP